MNMKRFTARLSLRARLYLFSGAILTLFAINVSTHLWGSLARTESLVAYRDTVNAAQLTSDLQQSLEATRQQVLVLSTLRETTDEPLDVNEQTAALTDLENIETRLRRLGTIGTEGTEDYYRRLQESTTSLISGWRAFYRQYNDTDATIDVDSAVNFNDAIQRLGELDQRQEFLAIQRSNAIDRTIALTDRITVIGFITTIAVTLVLVVVLIRATNASLQRLKTGAQRFGSGDLTYRIRENLEAGEIRDLAHTFNDMSGKLQIAIDEVQSAKADADSANAAKSMFLANVSHELRTPLNAIIGYSEMLQDEIGDPGDVDRDQFRHDLGTIIFSGRQLLSLINDILDLSKIETGKMQVSLEWFQPSALIFQVCDALSPLVNQYNNRLELDIDNDAMGEMHSDPGKLQQIITNLFSNSCKFTEDGVITVAATMDDKWLTVVVSDTGIGMTADQQSRVFQAFVQAESSTGVKYGGTGLGLAIVREFCSMLGGHIELESKPGVGSRFSVQLPVDPESALANA